MNFLFEKAGRWDYDYIAGTNVDDYYALNRLEKQIEYAKQGYDIISSNFSLVRNDKIVLEHKFDKLNIKNELQKNHNPLCHPVIMYSRKFIENERYDPAELPVEDRELWKRTIDKYRFVILPENLCYHRVDNH